MDYFLMLIGFDLDNTLVCYDNLFWSLSVERGWIDREIPPRKELVRNELRRQGREADWTMLQGLVYGPQMKQAVPFPGVLQMLEDLRDLDWTVCIVSHRTRTPFAGPAYDLHEAARDWLQQNGFLEEHQTGLTADRVYLETSKADKLARIGALSPAWFIDDLPELLTDPDFPVDVRRMLFDPHRHYPQLPDEIVIAHDLTAIPIVVAGGPSP